LVNTVPKAVAGIVSARRVRAMARVLAGPAVIAASLAGCASAPGPAASPRWEVSSFHRGPDNAIVRVVTDRRLVALTFDDGPSARYTPAILRRLRAAGARATFFMVGESALREPGIVRAAVRAGHEIGNHTFDHPRLPDLSSAAVAWELRAGARALERMGAPTPRYARPPWGDFDDRVGAIAAAQGSPLIGWDVVLDKALHGGDVTERVGALAARVRPGSIILAHDGRGTRGARSASGRHRRSMPATTSTSARARGTSTGSPPAVGGCSTSTRAPRSTPTPRSQATGRC